MNETPGKSAVASRSNRRPRVGTVIGDVAGIGPEVVAKAWATGEVHAVSRPVLIGSAHAMRDAVDIAGLSMEVRTVAGVDQIADDPRIIDIIDNGALDPADIRRAEDTLASGAATGSWLGLADEMARRGDLDATIMGPVSAKALEMAGALDKAVRVVAGETYLLLLTGPLRVLHLTDHMPLRQVCDTVSADLVDDALTLLDKSFRAWGIANPRIGVAGLNAHAAGVEDREQIAPGVELARAKGIGAEGPLSPDTVFRRCIEDRYDVVLAMYHDQGHIAVKTWGFSGNCVVVLGLPYLHLSVAHGTAFDIAGKGIADHSMILEAMVRAGQLCGGAGL